MPLLSLVFTDILLEFMVLVLLKKEYIFIREYSLTTISRKTCFIPVPGLYFQKGSP